MRRARSARRSRASCCARSGARALLPALLWLAGCSRRGCRSGSSSIRRSGASGPRGRQAPAAAGEPGAAAAGLFEDLHWIDTETQALLDSLVESLPTARLLLLVNYRPEYQHGWGSKTYYRQLRIDPLPPESAEELLETLLGDDLVCSR